jgi:hypothetical protein
MQITTIGLDIERVSGPRHRCGREGRRQEAASPRSGDEVLRSSVALPGWARSIHGTPRLRKDVRIDGEYWRVTGPSANWLGTATHARLGHWKRFVDTRCYKTQFHIR